MTRDDLFNVNAGIIRDISREVAKSCPKAFFAIITNPVNSCVPIAAEVLKAVSDPTSEVNAIVADCVFYYNGNGNLFVCRKAFTIPGGCLE